MKCSSQIIVSSYTIPCKSVGSISEENSGNLVDFDGPGDPSNPLNWAPAYKWSILLLTSLMSLFVNLAILLCAPTIPLILAEFHSTDLIESTLLVSIWELGEVVGPLIVGPLSEIFGRLPVYHISNVLFVLFNIGTAESQSLNMLVAFRFLSGLAVASSTLNSCIVGDMFKQEERGRAISFMAMSPFIAPVLGPTIGGFLSNAKGWRWTSWFIVIVVGAFEVIFLVVFRETYKVKILERKAAKLRRQTGNPNLQSAYALSISGPSLLFLSITRPFKLLFLSPVVFLVSLCGGLAYGCFYVIVTSVSQIFEQIYHFGQGPVGLSFLGLGFGMGFSVIFCSMTLDWYLNRKSLYGDIKPEYRLPPMVVGCVVLPLGMFIFAWTVQLHVHWIFPILSTSVIGFGLVATTLAISTYLVDSFGIYVASAVATATMLRNIMATFFPLAGPSLYAKVGYGWGDTILAFVTLTFAPIPLILMKYGEGLRQKSRFQVH